MTARPFSEACEQNKAVILDVLRAELPATGAVLEIGSGTGQHAVYFAGALPALRWIASDVPAHHAGIRAWMDACARENLEGPLALDVRQPHWPVREVAAVFSANTAHIMDWPAVQAMVAGVGRILPAGGVFCLYGPFNYGGAYTSQSNAQFDAWLRARDPASGVRDFEAVDALAREAGLGLRADHAMPANNRTLVWRRAAVK